MKQMIWHTNDQAWIGQSLTWERPFSLLTRSERVMNINDCVWLYMVIQDYTLVISIQIGIGVPSVYFTLDPQKRNQRYSSNPQVILKLSIDFPVKSPILG